LKSPRAAAAGGEIVRRLVVSRRAAVDARLSSVETLADALGVRVKDLL